MEKKEGKKFDQEKVRLDLMPPDAEWAIAEVFTNGAFKYGDRNWELGMDWHRIYGALQRHLHAFWSGEDYDSEWNKLHLAHAGCCVLMLLSHQLRCLGKDDRNKLIKENNNEN